MENDVIRLAGELSVAVEVIMNPNVSQQARMDAYVACEKWVFIQYFVALFFIECTFIRQLMYVQKRRIGMQVKGWHDWYFHRAFS